ncbi:MAG: hypothetical protein ABSG81_07540 [Acidimicrobiales bacterium]
MRGLRRHRTRDVAGDHELVRECTAFLSGCYPGHLVDAGLPVPAWAWLNPVAHGSVDSVRMLASGATLGRPAPYATGAWTQAVAFLASEVLRLVGDDPAGLLHVQGASLVPLELAMAGSRARLDPHCLVAMVLDALDVYRAPGRR